MQGIFWTTGVTVILCIMVCYKISQLYNSDVFLITIFPFKITEMGKCLQKHIAFFQIIKLSFPIT